MGARDHSVYAALENWARWCRRVAGCFPEGYACMSAEGKLWTPYRNADQSVDEKLDELREHQDPDELHAMRVERIVVDLKLPLRAVLRVHYVLMPDHERDSMLTVDQWNERRARFATRRSGWYFSPPMYLEAVDRAVNEVEARL